MKQITVCGKHGVHSVLDGFNVVVPDHFVSAVSKYLI